MARPASIPVNSVPVNSQLPVDGVKKVEGIIPDVLSQDESILNKINKRKSSKIFILPKYKSINLSEEDVDNLSHSFFSSKTIFATIDKIRMRYNNGLTPEEEKEYSEKIGIDLDSRYRLKPHMFYESDAGKIKLQNVPFVLDLDNPIEYVRYRIAMASGYLAPNKYAIENDSKYINCHHYVEDIYEEEKHKASVIQKRDLIILKINELQRDGKIGLLYILNYITNPTKRINVLSKQSDSYIIVHLNKYQEGNTMSRMYEIITKITVENMIISGLLLEMCGLGVCTINAGSFFHKEERLGKDLKEAVAFLKQERGNPKLILFKETRNKYIQQLGTNVESVV